MSVRPVRPVRRGPLIAALLATGLLLTGCSGLTGTTDHADNVGSAPGGTAAKDKVAAGATGAAGQPAPEPQIVEPEEIPDLGPATRAEISPRRPRPSW